MTDPIELLLTEARRIHGRPTDLSLREIIGRLAGQVADQITATTIHRDANKLLDCTRTLTDLRYVDAAWTVLNAMRSILPETDDLAVRAVNRQAMVALARGHYSVARELLEGAYIDAGRADSPLVSPILANLALVEVLTGDKSRAQRRITEAGMAGSPAAAVVLAAVATEIARQSADPSSVAQKAAELRTATMAYLEDANSDDQFALSAFSSAMTAEFGVAIQENASGRAAQTIDALEIAARRSAAMLGAAHPQVLVTAANTELARFELARDTNDPASVERVIIRMRRTGGRMRASLGDDHPRCLLTEANIASADFELARMRRSIHEARGAVARMKSTSDRLSAVLGPTHPQALMILSNLASAQLDVARGDGTREDALLAWDTLEVAAVRSTAVFGNWHPATRLIDAELGLCRQLISNDDSGGALLTRQRTIAQSTFGDEYLPFAQACVALGTSPEKPWFEALPQLTVLDAAVGSRTASIADEDDLAVVVSAAAAGDRAAIDRLLSYIRPLMVRYCRARVGRQERSFASADDVAQEICLAVLTALGSYRDQGRPFLAFVYGIAAHKVADAHRAAARNRAEPVADIPDEPELDAGPEQRAMRVEMTPRMAELLQVLPAKQREILILRVVVGLTAEETAEAVGSTPGAVRVAQHRALARLRSASGQ